MMHAMHASKKSMMVRLRVTCVVLPHRRPTEVMVLRSSSVYLNIAPGETKCTAPGQVRKMQIV